MQTRATTNYRHGSGRAVAIGASMVEQGAFSHLQGLTGGRLVWFSAGVGGERTDEIEARFATDVFVHNPRLCIVDAGMNDVIQDVAQATIEANFDSMAAALEAEGIVAIFATMQPFANYGGWTEEREEVRQNLDAKVKADFRYFDYTPVTGTGDPAAVRAEYDSGDGLHLNNTGDLAVSHGAFTQLFAERVV